MEMHCQEECEPISRDQKLETNKQIKEKIECGSLVRPELDLSVLMYQLIKIKFSSLLFCAKIQLR